ncbi:helix-turn-helix transcriptional regulator [Sinorhizobium medicae]|uniref:helix-turn-helix transcriptional regulator n=1 Tax=Sinorhizobium medicae TaxID=110321 RepID=UPI001AACEC42|nr:helix-turn-helix transcriptional regulator [Sinorhizobium medicae]MBO1943151.1 helix-turn-helix transcriptional regulator [Sinorhizobium medicae]
MNETLKTRIRERMTSLGMNPSSVALEAGLSRSAVRDILSGKAKNPGMMTVHAIARVLKCSDNYLMGFADEMHYAEATDILIDVAARLSDSSGTLEAGVFRQSLSYGDILPGGDPFAPDDHRIRRRERKPLESRRRYIGRDLYLYVLGDDSLDEVSILKGDLLLALHDPSGAGMDFKEGKIVIVSHRVPGLDAEELSARLVNWWEGKPFLVSASSRAIFAPIHVAEALEKPNTYRTLAGGIIEVEGIAVEITRQLDV